MKYVLLLIRKALFNKSYFLLISLIVLLLILRFNFDPYTLPGVINEVSDFDLISNTGEQISKKELLGKITVLDFIYTRCTGTCPILANHMKKLYDEFKDYPTVQFISISIDPSDTQKDLNDYAIKNGVYDDRWKFLYGDSKFLQFFSKSSFNINAENSVDWHSKKMFLIDSNYMIRQFYNGTLKKDVNLLKNHLYKLIKEKNQNI